MGFQAFRLEGCLIFGLNEICSDLKCIEKLIRALRNRVETCLAWSPPSQAFRASLDKLLYPGFEFYSNKAVGIYKKKIFDLSAGQSR